MKTERPLTADLRLIRRAIERICLHPHPEHRVTAIETVATILNQARAKFAQQGFREGK